MKRMLLWLAVASPLLIAGCGEYQICGNAGASNCCAIKYGDTSTVAYCVGACTDCIKAASESGGSPSCPAEESGWHDTYTYEGCKTGERKKSLFKAEVDGLFEAPQTRVIKVKMTEDPLDCAAICEDTDNGACAAAKVVPTTAQQLQTFQERLASASGEIPVSEIHDIFNVMASADTCRRKGVIISGNRLENSGPYDCNIETAFSIGAKEIPLTLKISRDIQGIISDTGNVFSVRFPDDEHSGTIEIGDALLNQKYGGPVTNVDVAGGNAYFSTPNSCIALSLD